MIKKILTTSFFLAFIAVLVVGGIIRTQAVNGSNGDGSLITNGNGNWNGNSESVIEQPSEPISSSDWVTVAGTVQSLEADSLKVLSDSGEVILIDGRSGRFLTEQYFTAAAGDQVSLTGFYEDGAFEVASVTNQTSGVTVTLRGSDGRPRWGGGGH
jgi:hypothetical protein